MRRTGKTTIFYQLIHELIKKGIDPRRILYLSLDHPALQEFSLEEILEIYRYNVYAGEDLYLFLDEIHYAKNWDRWLKTFYDLYPNIRLVAASAASLALLKGKWESGAGRITEISVPTLSFYEYCCLRKIDFNISETLRLNKETFNNEEIINELKLINLELEKYFTSYLFTGGFPEFVQTNDVNLDDLQELIRVCIIENILKKDLPNYYDMRNAQNIGRLFYYFCNTTSDLLSVETVTKELSTISRDTVEKYIDYLESAYLINMNSPIFLEGKKVLKARPKIYVSDPSVLNAMISGRPEFTTPETLGKMVESAVFNSLSNYFKNLNVKSGFLRGGKRNEKEIDLVIKRPFNTDLCFEVKYRNKPEIKISDLVNEVSKAETFIVTKRSVDFGIRELSSGKKVNFIPAPILLYLTGWAQYFGINIFD